MAKRATGLPNMKVGKAKAPKKTSQTGARFKIQVGTPAEMRPVVAYMTRGPWRKAAREAFAEWLPWCERYNRAGLDRLRATIAEVESAVVATEPRTFECQFDDRSGLTVKVVMWEAILTQLPAKASA